MVSFWNDAEMGFMVISLSRGEVAHILCSCMYIIIGHCSRPFTKDGKVVMMGD